MTDNFFNVAKIREQKRRHLNTVYNACLVPFIEDPSTMHRIIEVRNSKGHKALFHEVFDNLLPMQYCEYLIFLKNRLKIDDETFEEVIGFQERLSEIKTPGGYDQKEDFVLLFHLLLVLIMNEFNNIIEQNDFVVQLGKGFNYSIEQIQFIMDVSAPYCSMLEDFNDIQEIEQKVLREFLIEYETLPNLSHA